MSLGHSLVTPYGRTCLHHTGMLGLGGLAGGGERRARVLDRFPIRLTTWAETPAEAVAEANLAMARLVSYEGREIGGVPCYRVTPLSTPYEPVDPAHPDIPRAIQTAHLWVRAVTTNE